jgi:hypothetical membrane protein
LQTCPFPNAVNQKDERYRWRFCGNFKKYDGKTREPVGAALLSGWFGDPWGSSTPRIFYPAGYSTANSEISDLGANSPPDSIICQPSASIFNATMIIGGLLVLGASFFLFREYKLWTVVLFPMLLGIGVLGVCIFPGNMAPFHGVFALVAFISGGLSAITSARVVPGPFSYILALLGFVTLVFLVFASVFIPVLGDGNRTFIAYPVVIWGIGFGGVLIGIGG